MTGSGAKPRRREIRKYLLLTVLAGLLLLAGLAWYMTTDSFQAMVRRRVVGELERITGGRVDLGVPRVALATRSSARSSKRRPRAVSPSPRG